MSGWMRRIGHNIYNDVIDLARMAIQTGLIAHFIPPSQPSVHPFNPTQLGPLSASAAGRALLRFICLCVFFEEFHSVAFFCA